MSTLASANEPLTVHKDKSFNYFDKVQHENTLPDWELTGAGAS